MLSENKIVPHSGRFDLKIIHYDDLPSNIVLGVVLNGSSLKTCLNKPRMAALFFQIHQIQSRSVRKAIPKKNPVIVEIFCKSAVGRVRTHSIDFYNFFRTTIDKLGNYGYF